MKVIQKRVVRIKFDIYVFITNGLAILALSKHDAENWPKRLYLLI